jgi:hypothetical protein
MKEGATMPTATDLEVLEILRQTPSHPTLLRRSGSVGGTDHAED